MKHLFCLLLAATVAGAGETVFRIQELLNRDWQNALVDRPFAAEPGQCHPGSVALKGPQGLQPVQLSEIELYPDTEFVKTARVSFLASLPARTVGEWTLTYGPQPLPVRKSVGYELTAEVAGDTIMLANAAMAIGLAAGGEEFAEPRAAGDVPAPVRGIDFGDGLGLAGSDLYGPAKIRAWRGELLAAGPVFGEAQVVYTYADGRELTVRVRLAAHDTRAYWSMFVAPHDIPAALELLHLPGFYEGAELVKKHLPADGWRLRLTAQLPELCVRTVAEFGDNRWGQRAYKGGRWEFEEVDVTLAKEPAGTIINFVPWHDWWSAVTRDDMVFNTPKAGDVFAFVADRPGEWVEPAKAGTWITWGNPRQRQKWVRIERLEDDSAAADFNLASGWRYWIVENRRAGKVEDPTLNTLASMIVDWPADPAVTYPHLFVTPAQLAEIQSRGGPDPGLYQKLKSRWAGIQPMPHGSDVDAMGMYLLSGKPEIAEQTHVVERLRRHLKLMGRFDTMRSTVLACGLYDGLMGTDLISPEEKAEFRARMAYLGYFIASPVNWSMQRGYCSGNENMSVSHVLNAGTIACTIPDHPMAKTWVAPALEMTNQWLRTYVGPNGAWPESVSNYAHVSCSHLFPFVIAARNSGFHDYVNDIDLKRLALYLSKQYTPPDPRSGGQRRQGFKGVPPLGRAGAGGAWALDGLMAFATRDSDPKLSRQLQWTWLGTGQSRQLSNSGLGGFEFVVLDPTLPSEVPNWTYDVFPDVGAVIRHGIGTRNVWYLNFMCNYSFGYMGESGQFATIFAKGEPISARFAGGYAEREELLISRVLPARSPATIEERYASFEHDSRHRMTANSALPRQDYLEAHVTMLEPRAMKPFDGHNHPVEAPAWPPTPVAEPNAPVDWHRQVLFIKDADPGKTNYLVLRDTVSGGQPTMWQWWAVSNKIGTADEVRDRDAFLVDAPGNATAPARRLDSDRLTALGPYGVDTEFYVAAPTGTPRHTLRWGHEYHYSPIHMWNEYMDLLHLQRPDDGAYFVVVCPRRTDEPVPEFATLADGYAVQVSGDFGKDVVFMTPTPRSLTAAGATFLGTVGSVQDRPDGVVLSLGAGGRLAYGDHAIECDQPCSLIVRPGDVRVNLTDLSPGAYVDIVTPGDWTLDTGQGNTIRKLGDTWRLKVMQDVTELRLYPQ